MLQSKESDSQLALGMGLELWGQRKDGTEFPVDVMLSVLQTDDGVIVTSIIRDITERKRFENQLQHLADHDALTELFNRRRFDQELAEYVAYTARYGGQGAVFLLDLDRFKYVNDTRGHKAGDEVIRAVGRALHDSVRKTDVVARLGGDEFAVLLRDADRDTAERIAEGMLETIRERRLPLEGQRISMTTSIGIVCFDDEEPAVEDVMVSADLAMYAAKEAGGNRYHVATADGGEYVSGMQVRLNWADQIRRALDEDRFVLYCQPILHLATDCVTQYELLLRMVGDDGEIIMPAAFIDTAERFGLIQEIDQWVARKAIHLLAEHDVRLEVNVSGKSMGDLAIPELVEREIALTGIDPSRLVFEITETAAIANMEQARAFAERLTRLGCRFALDDFGAGFSSFYYLKYLPLDYLKIDGDFIRSLTSSVTDQLVVKSMVDIARGMGMKTIAEFVEAEETVVDAAREGRRLLPGLLPRRTAAGGHGVRTDRGAPMSGAGRPGSAGEHELQAQLRQHEAGQRLLRQPGARLPDAGDAGLHVAHDDGLHRHLRRARRVRLLVPRRPSRVHARDRREDRHVARVQGQRRDGLDGQHQGEPVRGAPDGRLLRDRRRPARQRHGDDRRERRGRGVRAALRPAAVRDARCPRSPRSRRPRSAGSSSRSTRPTSTAPSTSRCSSTRRPGRRVRPPRRGRLQGQERRPRLAAARTGVRAPSPSRAVIGEVRFAPTPPIRRHTPQPVRK